MSEQQKHAAPKIEAWCIGALLDADGPVLRSSAAQLVAASGLTAEDFTRPDFRAYFGAIVALGERGRPAEPSTVTATTRGMPGVPPEPYQGLEALRGANTASREAFASHAEELRRLSHLRRLEAFHRAQLAALEKPRANPAELATAVETFAHTFGGDTQGDETGDRDMFELLEDWDAFAKGIRAPTVPTGIQALDAVLRGWACNLNVIGGLPSVGKSALAGECIWNALRSGMRVGVFGLEDATKWISKRLLSREMGMKVGEIAATRLHDFQQERLQQAAGEIAQYTRNMLVYRRAGITPEALLARCRHWVLNKGVQLIFVDHGGEVQHSAGAARDRYDLAVANTYRALRDLAVNHRVPVVVLCHFNRETSDRGKPTPQSFAETAYIERMARVALGLWERDGEANRLLVTLLKVTEGERGQTVWLPRDRNHALVSSQGGGLVDLEGEAQEQREQQRAAKAPRRDWRANP